MTERDLTDGAEVLDAVVAYIRKYVWLSASAANFCALWAMHTWAFEAAECTPYLRVISPERRSGKSRLLELLEKITRRGWHTFDVTAAVLYRRGEMDAPTLLFDEVDEMPFDDRRGVVSVLNSGYKISGTVWRSTDKGELQQFNAFFPKALAGLDDGKIPDTVADRCIHVRLKRRRPGETVAKFKHAIANTEAEPLADAMHAWAVPRLEKLAHSDPEPPFGLNDREEEVWEPLLAIADLAGGDWPQRARQAAVVLAGERGEDEDTVGVRLLASIRALFTERGDPQVIGTQVAADYLNGLDEAAWATWNNNTGIKIHDVTRLLRRYDCGPDQRRPRGGGQPTRGLWLDRVNEAASRYLATDPRYGGTPGTAVRRYGPDDGGTDITAGQDGSVPDVPAVPLFPGSEVDVPPEERNDD